MTDALRFTSLRVRRMPGIGGAGFALDDLCAGINVVHGPNASGKTTTARALQSLLWPSSSPPRALLEGRFALDGREWRVDVDAGTGRWRRDGDDADPPALPATESRHRYALPLHELIRKEDADFAAEIARESAGGYDVGVAADALGFGARASRATTERRVLEEARRALRDAEREQERLRHEQSGLGELERRREDAESAKRRVELWDCALARLEAARELEAAERELAAFPDGMARLHGDDADRLRAAAEALDDAREKRRTAERHVEDARRALEDTGLDDALPGELLPALRNDVETLQRLERDREAAAREAAGADARAERELRALGDAVDVDALDEIDHVAFDELAGFAERAEEVAARGVKLEAEIDAIRDATAPEDLDSVRDGARLLRQWLVTGDGADRERRLRAIAVTAAAAAILAGGALGLLHPALVAAAVPGVVLLVLSLSRGPASASRARLEKDFRKLDLDGPARWRRDAVGAHLDALDARVAEARSAATRAARREHLEAELETVREEAEALAAERRQLAGRLGVTPAGDALEGTGSGAVKLYWLANRIGRWQDASHDAHAARAGLAAVDERLAEALEAARRRLEPFGYDTVDDAAAVAGAVDDLDARRQARETAIAAAESAELRRDEADDTIARLAGERAAVFERLGLAADAEATVADWCARRDEYVHATDRRTRAEAALEAAHEALSGHPDYEPGLEDRTEAELEADRRADEDRAGHLDEVVEQIHRIRERIDGARAGHDIERALAEVEAAEDALRAARERDVRAALGHTLASFVHEWSRDHDRPPVFRRARELFAAITRGRYRLDLHDHADSPAFRAHDTSTGRRHTLDELSSGTRVQLLLAVRVAFVETQEQGVRLPLLLDETLGNSDDVRAHAIMEAVIALSREGRQVLYFTAQADEVGKWRALLEGDDAERTVEHRFVDLALARSLPAEDADTIRIAGPPRKIPPAPDGRDHRAYGDALGVPPIDPWAPASGAHLWYLVEDVDALHELLRFGAATWGDLRTLREHGGGDLPVLAGGLYDSVAAGARVLEAALEAWRVGRGRPVDRAVLEDSGAVSDTFIDRAVEACREVGGDAERALDAIGALPRFHTSKLEELRTYLTENGYLDPEPTLAPEEVRLRATAPAGADIAAGRLDADQVERLLGRLVGVAAGG